MYKCIYTFLNIAYAQLYSVSVEFCEGLRPCDFVGFFSTLFDMPISLVLFQFIFRESCFSEFMVIAPDVTTRHNLTGNSLIL